MPMIGKTTHYFQTGGATNVNSRRESRTAGVPAVMFCASIFSKSTRCTHSPLAPNQLEIGILISTTGPTGCDNGTAAFFVAKCC